VDIYNRHRPRTFKDMYQTSNFITQADKLIANTLFGTNPDLPHFIILHSEYGGLGKTTAGRIIASELNPEASAKEKEAIFTGVPNNLFIEINGSNYRKIDDVRKLEKEIEYMRHAILETRKVYMINEAHKLTPDAQEVFLQLTENIPPNIYLLFTTTRLDSMNDKLLGRAQKFVFKPLEKPYLKKLLLDIEQKERGNGVPDYVVDQIFEKSGSSLRESINTLGEYLTHGEVTPGIGDPEKEESHYFSEIVRHFELVAIGDEISWTRRIVPLINSMLNTYSVEEARVKLMYRLYGLLMDPRGIAEEGSFTNSKLRKAELYRTLAERFREPVGYPQKSDMVFNLYQCFMEARDIALKPIPKPASKKTDGR